MYEKRRRPYSFLLAFAGLSVAFIFMLFASGCVYGSVLLIDGGGFWHVLAGCSLVVPASWAVFLGSGVIARTVVHQP